MRLRPVVVLLAVAALLVPAAAATAAARTSGRPRVVVVQHGLVTRQDIPSSGGSEPDTVVEPDVAVDPLNSDIAVAAAHDSRFADGGAVGISVAWTRNGAGTWHHYAVPGITKGAGGVWDRASDPVVAFGPDGTAYLSVLLFMAKTCPTAVAVLRSDDGGRTWSKPVYADRRTSCDFSDDKNWIVVDRHRTSPHYGRIYQFWTPFLSQGGLSVGDPQAVRWSDDRGTTWSAAHFVTAKDRGTQNSQPMILADGTVVDTFFDYGQGVRSPDARPGGVPEARGAAVRQRRAFAVPTATVTADVPVESVVSTDGGATWSPEHEVVATAGGAASGVRCCLFAADIDALTHRMYVVYEGGVAATDPVYLTSSDNGVDWSAPIQVSRGDIRGVQRVNVDVVARGGTVYVDYGTRTDPSQNGGFVQQQLSTSTDGGRSFGPPMSLGPRSVLKYAARSEGYFPGDYIGAAITAGRVYLVWAVSSQPPATSTSKYHQVIYGTALRT